MSNPSVSEFKPRLFIKQQKLEVSFFLERLNERHSVEMMEVPAGRFLMGSPSTEKKRSESEEPQHAVNIQKFWMGKYPVTQEEWAIVSQFPQEDIELMISPSSFKREKLPVESISWYEALEYCKRISEYTNRSYRLPSEAEWEYACRAGTTTPFHYGEMITSEFVNYDGSRTYGDGPKGEYREETTEVGSFHPNANGLHDMHGNVFEWCTDHWHENYEGAPLNGFSWIEDGSDNRVVRGGSWYVSPGNCRSAYRSHFLPTTHYSSLGFRVVCEF